MQPVKIVIEGGYWDPQIYSGELICSMPTGRFTRLIGDRLLIA